MFWGVATPHPPPPPKSAPGVPKTLQLEVLYKTLVTLSVYIISQYDVLLHGISTRYAIEMFSIRTIEIALLLINNYYFTSDKNGMWTNLYLLGHFGGTLDQLKLIGLLV